MRTSSRKSESGVVLIVVLGGILVLCFIAFALTSSVRVGVEELENRKEHLQSYYLARGAVLTAAVFLARGPLKPQEGLIQPGQQIVAWREGPGRVSVEITDENGKIDLNQASEAVLERLIMALGPDLPSARSVATAIADWRTPSSLTRWKSAVASGNLMQFDSSGQTNIDYRSVEELLNVPGVTPDLFYGHYIRHDDGKIERQLGLIDCVTVDSGSAQININYAPRPVLLSVSGLEPRVADFILAGRVKKPFLSAGELTSEFPASLSVDTLSTLTTQSSGRFTLLASGSAHGDIVARMQAVINIQAANNAPFEILRWKDSYVQ